MIYSLNLASAQDYVVGKVITGSISGATALITKITGTTFYVEMTSSRLCFIDDTDEQDGETVTVEDSSLSTTIDTALGLISLATQSDLYAREPLIRDFQWETDSDFLRIMDKAFEDVVSSLNIKGIDATRIRQKHSKYPRFKTLHEYKCLELIMGTLRKQEGDPYDLKFNHYAGLYYEGAKGVTYDYDYDKDGIIDETEEDFSNTQIRFVR